jgi:peptide methionine sulfoxide reductase msrA/msrB
VVSHTTGFAETVKVKYDPEQVDLKLLIDLYFKTIDPTSLNQQGNDRETNTEQEFIIQIKQMKPL